LNFLWISSLIFLASTTNSYAYIDPGIGAIFLQGLLATIAGVSIFFSRARSFFAKIIGLKENKKINKDKKHKL